MAPEVSQEKGIGGQAEEHSHDYVAALKYPWLNSLYDPLVGLLMREREFRTRLVEQLQVGSGHRVLDVGCGTATLTLLIKEFHRDAEVIGIDGDPGILAIARKKAARAGLDATFAHGMAFALPYADESFDRVVSSLVLHHLSRENKQRALREAWRVLRLGGQLHIADWGPPSTGVMRLLARLVRKLDGTDRVQDNLDGLLPVFMCEAGLADVRENSRMATAFGTLSFYSASKPRATGLREGV